VANAHWYVIAILCLVIAAGGAVIWRLRRELRFVHKRLHQLNRRQGDVERGLADASRWVCSARAHDRGQNGSILHECRSQHGEELTAWTLLGEKPKGTYVDIGAYDGLNLSNTAFFESLGWSGLLVEAHPELAEQCRRNRPKSDVVHAAVGDVGCGPKMEFSMVRGESGVDTLSFSNDAEANLGRIAREGGKIEKVAVPAMPLRSLLAAKGIREIDLLSIDVEGAEMSVLRGAGLNDIRCRLIIIEDNSEGADRSVAEYLGGLGFRRVCRVGCNDFYLRGSS
jgi:FkbM family methyltransferase